MQNKSSKSVYKKYRNLLTRVKELSKKLFLQNSIDKAGNDNKKIWKVINSTINYKQPKQSHIDKVIDPNNNEIVNDPTKISNLMNSNYVSLVDNLIKKYPRSSCNDENYDSDQTDRVHESFILKSITVAEVKRYINELNKNKSTRSDLPRIIFLKMSVNVIAPIVSEILNSCISTGFFPSSLKLAEIIPIYKSGSKTDINNYRPISLLSPFSKIFESHIHNNLNKFFSKHSVIYRNQFGFQKNNSTELAVINSINDIISSLDNKLVTCAIFLDLAKAFNSVNHKILLNKLEKYGIRGIPLLLLENYLNNREQVTNVNNFKSSKLHINVGVPQGSCLGPLLFLIYINDMHLCTSLKIRLFADDACVSFSHENPIYLENKINTELVKIDSWLITNKLFLNYSKSNFLVFSRKKHKYCFKISINSNILKQEQSAKYLGIIIDDKLCWKQHLSKLKTSLSRSCYAICKLKNYANLRTLKSVYYSLFYSKLKYCISSWGSTASSNLEEIFRLQKRALRFVCSEHYKSPTNPLFIKMGMLKLPEIHMLEICKLIHHVLNSRLQGNLQLDNLHNTHHHNTRLRSGNNFYIGSSRTGLGKQGFSVVAPKFWQEVPKEFKLLPFNAFKYKLKNKLLEKYSHQILP